MASIFYLQIAFLRYVSFIRILEFLEPPLKLYIRVHPFWMEDKFQLGID